MSVIALIATIGLLNLFDLLATLQWIVVDADLEANPIMRELWIYNPRLFILAKLLITAAFCIIAYRTKRNRLMKRLIWLPFCAYIIVNLMHAQILI